VPPQPIVTTDLPIAAKSHDGWSMANSRMISLSGHSWVAHPDADFHDLGVHFCANRLGVKRRKREHIRHLEALGYKVAFEPAA
jgi:hypothetical protein